MACFLILMMIASDVMINLVMCTYNLQNSRDYHGLRQNFLTQGYEWGGQWFPRHTGSLLFWNNLHTTQSEIVH